MSASWILQTDSWGTGYRRIAEAGSVLLESLYQKANRFRLGPISGGDLFQAAFLNICLCLPYVIFHCYRAAIVYLVQRVLHPAEAQLPGFVDSVNVPRLYPIVHVVFFVSLLAPRSLLPAVAVGGVFALALLGHLFDPLSALALVAFLAVVYLVFTVSWMSRAWKLGCVLVVYLLFMNACQLLEKLPAGAAWPSLGTLEIVELSRFGPGFIPLLWYAGYEICAGRLGYLRFNLYLLLRFLETPVFPVRDFLIDWERRRQWQWRGLFTLSTAFVAIGCSWLLKRYLATAQDPAWHLSSGVKLAWFSYCYYLSLCFTLVGAFNLFVGWARLFGIPIKDVFYFWLLARTPNERWQRWNILFREWIITYVFYPMMRAKRGLFISIMATLLLSGVLHLFGSLTLDYGSSEPGLRFDIIRAGRILTYWTLNGLAIYVVILIPRRFPDLMDRLRVRESIVWSMLGIVVTSIFYSTLFVLRDKCETPIEWWGFMQRLLWI